MTNFFLKKGDIIDIIAPSSGCDVKYLLESAEWLVKMGYSPRFSKDILKTDMYLAQNDEFRFKDLKKALQAKDSKMIWCLRGGYGAIRLLPQILKLKKTSPKIFLGLSDITVLHYFLNEKWGWPTVHGPMLDRSVRGEIPAKDAKELFSILENKTDFIDFKKLKPVNPAAQKLMSSKKTIASTIMGGNMRTLCSMVGSPLKIQFKNKFLFLEDVSERGYKVDRLLQQLSLSGALKGCKGVFLGDFIRGEEADGKNYVWPTFENFFKESNIPVFKGIESDHSKNQRPLFLNTKSKLIYNNGKPVLRVFNQ